MEFTFLYPRFLFLLFLVPFFLFVYFFSLIYNKKKALLYANFEAMERFYDIEFFSKNFMALYINLLVLVLLIFAIAGMGVSFKADSSTYSYVIAIDTSESMGADDLSPNRLEAAKAGAKWFVDLLPVGTEIGVISFSGDAKVLHVLSTNKEKVKAAISEASFGRIPGTNVYNAIISANKLLKDKRFKSVVLFSDGQSNVNDAPSIIEYLKRNEIVVNSIAVGTKEGGVSTLKVISKLDEDFLKSLAFNSGGQFFLVSNRDKMSRAIDKIANLKNKTVHLDLSFYLLLAAVVLFSISWILHNLRFRVVP
ncbi:VWA domain-containing protein [Candidatus Pacearchaeota archaeon]|nr:MAG: VWA domain-containing protein [Candidatus Pacearchaeota archaeon]